MIAHRPKALEGVDHVLVIAEGAVQSFGRKEDVLTKVLRRRRCRSRSWPDGEGGDAMDGEVTPALHSIQRYMIVGMVMFGFVTFGIGGWAATIAS